MPVKVGINGFGRIGRLFFRALLEEKALEHEFEVVALNDLVTSDYIAYLLKYDSVHGRFPGSVSAGKSDVSKCTFDQITVNGRTVTCLALKVHPEMLPWKDLGVDIVFEATGQFIEQSKVEGHLDAGAKRVILSAPAKGSAKTIVVGVNDDILTSEDSIVSNASCTTNCLAPICKVLLDNFGIEEGLMTTVHSFTSTQKTCDGPSSKSWKNGRAASVNLIPSTTGAAEAVGLVIPELKGKLTGMAFRVPTVNVSAVDLTVRTSKETNYSQICESMKKAAAGKMRGILDYTEDDVVSTDFIHDPASSIFDAGAGIELNSTFFKLISWYDNEWGYVKRCVDLLRKVASFL